MKKYFTITSMGFALLLVSCGKKETVNTTSKDKGAADGTYILASSDLLPPAGKILTVNKVMEMKDAKLSVSMGAKQMAGTMSHKTEAVESMEPVSANKIRHVNVSEIDKGTLVMEGQEQPTPPKNNPLIGIPVIVEVNDGKVIVTLEKGAPTEAQQKELDKLKRNYESNDDFVMYGDKPRKPGDKWDVDPSKLSDFSGGNGLSGAFTVEFKSIEEFNGVTCAKLECVFDITGKMIADGEESDSNLTLKGKAEVIRSIEDHVDLEVKLTGGVIIEQVPAEGMKVRIDGKTEMLQKAELK